MPIRGAALLYLQRSVVNLSRETIRRRLIERRVLNAGRAEPPPPDQDAVAMVELRRAIAALPLRERQRVVLRYLPGLAEAEAASLPGVSAGAVKSRTQTGLRLLRERLAEVTTAAGSATAAEGTAK